MIDKARNAMMTEAPKQKEYHFPGESIWHAQTIAAATLEEAAEIWHKTKQLVNPGKSVEIAAPLSTDAASVEENTKLT